MTMPKRRTTLVILALLAGAVVAGTLALRPRSNTLKVHVETIRDEEGHYHRRWTFTGGRWESYGQGFPTGEHLVVLDRPGVRDSAPIRSIKEALGLSASRLVYEVEARRVPPGEANGRRLVSVRRTLSGNGMGGAPGFNKTFLSPDDDTPWSARFRTTQAEDAIVTFPARLNLGDFGGLAEVIEFR